MQIENELMNTVLVVTPIENSIDASNSITFKGQVIDWINDGNSKILLDLSQVDFVDSSGLGSFVSIMKSLSGNGHFVICGASQPVKVLFQLTRMDRVFQIFDSREEGLGAFD